MEEGRWKREEGSGKNIQRSEKKNHKRFWGFIIILDVELNTVPSKNIAYRPILHF